MDKAKQNRAEVHHEVVHFKDSKTSHEYKEEDEEDEEEEIILQMSKEEKEFLEKS